MQHFLLALLLLLVLQIRRGVLGFELEQLPPDMAAAAGVPGQQQQPPGDVNHTDTSLATRSANPEEILGDLHHFRSSAAQLTDKIRYKEAADRLKAKLTHKTQALVRSQALTCGDGLIKDLCLQS